MQVISTTEGETVVVQCNATGNPPPTYTWLKHSTNESLLGKDRFTVQPSTGVLKIYATELTDTELYTCVAQNIADRVEEKVNINVTSRIRDELIYTVTSTCTCKEDNSKPSSGPIINDLVNVTASAGAVAAITCAAIGNPRPTVYFRKQASNEIFRIGRQTDRIDVWQRPPSKEGVSFGALLIHNVTYDDEGLYECVAENSIATAYKVVQLNVTFGRE